MKQDLVASKQLIDLLKTKVLCLGIEIVYDGDEGRVEHCEVDICPPGDIVDTHRCDFNDEESENP
jgi:hypothetical protein